MSNDRDNQNVKAAEVLERLFVGDDVDSHELVEAVSEAQSDEELRARYDRLAITDRELGGDFESRAGEAWFLDSLDEMLAEERRTQPTTSSTSVPSPPISLGKHREASRPVGGPRRPVAAMFASAALVMFGVAGVLQSEVGAPQPEFQARTAAKPDVSPYDAPNFEVFCVERSDGDVTFRGRDESEFATVHCPAAAEIKFAVSSTDPNLRHVAFFGISSDHTLYWYGPSPAATAAVEIEPSEKLQPVGETIRLQVNHAPGTVRVVGLFTERPLEYRDVELFVRSNLARLPDGTLAIDGGTVVRQTFEVNGP